MFCPRGWTAASAEVSGVDVAGCECAMEPVLRVPRKLHRVALIVVGKTFFLELFFFFLDVLPSLVEGTRSPFDQLTQALTKVSKSVSEGSGSGASEGATPPNPIRMAILPLVFGLCGNLV